MSTPATIEYLGQSAFHAYAKELKRLTGVDSRSWIQLPSEQMRCWHQAANTVVAHVAAFGYPRPTGSLEDSLREAGRCADWLRHVADGGDAGSHVRFLLLLRTAASELDRLRELAAHGSDKEGGAA